MIAKVELTPVPHARPAEAEPFDAFFRAWYHRVVGLVAVATGQPAAAEDAAQEAFSRAWSRWDSVGRLDAPQTWVLRVATRIAIDTWRHRRREVAVEPSLAGTAVDVIDRLWVRWEIGRLTPMQRAVVVLRYLEGRPVADVAAELERSEATAKTHLQLALRRLRLRMRQEREP